SACGVSASQLLGRSVANFFHPLRNTVKHNQGSPILKLGSGCVQPTGFLKITFQLIPEIPSLSADWLPSLIKAST
ncbi:hypothetical protein, partial [Peribacillus simplex]|uniref:hypothetical protein n=1 Tax=Peribacillus simplex TaxID=1478 RepID=UPI001C867562